MQKLRRFSNRFLIIVFSLILFIPGLGLFVPQKIEEFRALLKRDPYPFPSIDWINLGRTDFKAIENWFGDRALLLSSLSKFWSQLLYQLGSSSKPGQALLGKEDWLFLGNDYAATIDQFTGKNKPKKEELYLQLAAIQQMNRISKQHQIPFLVVLAPDKQDIYPEYLPANIRKGQEKNRLELLEELMADNQIDFVALTKKELSAKETLGKQYGDLYLKADSHWNYLGAYVAYQAIANQLKQYGLKIRALHYDFLPQKTTYSDLSQFLQLTHIQSNNPLPDISKLKIQMLGVDINQLTKPMSPFEGSPDLLQRPYLNINQALHNQQTCLLIGDSFSESLSFYFHNDFYKTVRIHSGNKNWNLSELIDRYHPDVIVYERIERDLLNPLFNFQPNAAEIMLPAVKQALRAKGEIEYFKLKQDKIAVNGWAYLPQQDAGVGEVFLKFSQGGKRYLFSMNKILKQKISLTLHPDGEHLNLAGFAGLIPRAKIPKGPYKISIIIQNKELIGEKKFSKTYLLS